MRFAGAAVDSPATRSLSIYRLDPQVLPYCPEAVSLLNRQTYWWWRVSEHSEDLIIASLHEMLILLFELLGVKDPADPTMYPGVLKRLSHETYLPGDCTTLWTSTSTATAIIYSIHIYVYIFTHFTDLISL